MVHGSLIILFQYGGYGLEVVLLVALLRGGYARTLAPLVVFVGAMLGVDAIIRPATLLTYGLHSRQYYYTYWLTEVLLIFAAFLLVCAFFRRAFRLRDQEMWSFVRPILLMILLMVLAVTSVDFRQHYRDLFTTNYIWEFNQNLCFTCLVLNTVLYLLLQRLKGTEAQLQLLVCGLGIQFAGPTANSALVHLTRNSHAMVMFFTYFSPICGLAMLGVWLYAVAHKGSEHSGGLIAGRRGLAVPVQRPA
ncbi:MAG TPA: hypothetical protein VL523_17830 [Terriglobia bacterium]|nr:hypothetical protein [Terriglobia bacterium]